MTKVANFIEFIKTDVNKEESMILSIFNKLLIINFKLILLFGLAFYFRYLQRVSIFDN